MSESVISVNAGVQLVVDTTDPNNYTLKIRANGVTKDVISESLDATNDVSVMMPAVTGVHGKSVTLAGQDADGSHFGGKVVLRGGGGQDSFGVEIQQRLANGSDFVIAQWFGEGGTAPKCTLCSVATSSFQWDGANVSLFQNTSGNQYYIDCKDFRLRNSQGGFATWFYANNTGIGFNNTSPIAKPTVSGSKGANAALASLITALANYGLVTDSTS